MTTIIRYVEPELGTKVETPSGTYIYTSEGWAAVGGTARSDTTRSIESAARDLTTKVYKRTGQKPSEFRIEETSDGYVMKAYVPQQQSTVSSSPTAPSTLEQYRSEFEQKTGIQISTLPSHVRQQVEAQLQKAAAEGKPLSVSVVQLKPAVTPPRYEQEERISPEVALGARSTPIPGITGAATDVLGLTKIDREKAYELKKKEEELAARNPIYSAALAAQEFGYEVMENWGKSVPILGHIAGAVVGGFATWLGSVAKAPAAAGTAIAAKIHGDEEVVQSAAQFTGLSAAEAVTGLAEGIVIGKGIGMAARGVAGGIRRIAPGAVDAIDTVKETVKETIAPKVYIKEAFEVGNKPALTGESQLTGIRIDEVGFKESVLKMGREGRVEWADNAIRSLNPFAGDEGIRAVKIEAGVERQASVSYRTTPRPEEKAVDLSYSISEPTTTPWIRLSDVRSPVESPFTGPEGTLMRRREFRIAEVFEGEEGRYFAYAKGKYGSPLSPFKKEFEYALDIKPGVTTEMLRVGKEFYTRTLTLAENRPLETYVFGDIGNFRVKTDEMDFLSALGKQMKTERRVEKGRPLETTQQQEFLDLRGAEPRVSRVETIQQEFLDVSKSIKPEIKSSGEMGIELISKDLTFRQPEGPKGPAKYILPDPDDLLRISRPKSARGMGFSFPLMVVPRRVNVATFVHGVDIDVDELVKVNTKDLIGQGEQTRVKQTEREQIEEAVRVDTIDIPVPPLPEPVNLNIDIPPIEPLITGGGRELAKPPIPSLPSGAGGGGIGGGLRWTRDEKALIKRLLGF
ncbi:MAG: hypothetical protein QXN57_03200 [Desulfurococcaceae archaeon]